MSLRTVSYIQDKAERLGRPLERCLVEQDRGRHAQRFGQKPDFDVSDLAFSAFDPFHGITTDRPTHRSGTAGQILLRKILLAPKALNRGTDRVSVGSLPGDVTRAWHGRFVAPMLLVPRLQ